MSNYKEERPWGTFENLLDTEYCKVKEILKKVEDRVINTIIREVKLGLWFKVKL